MTGRWKGGEQRYGCFLHHQGGDSVCTNNLLIRRNELEERLLRRLQESVLREDVIEYAIARLRDGLETKQAALLAERVGRFTLSRVTDSGEWSYTANGSVDFFGETALRVDGAGGQNRTGYARLFRAALYQ